MKSTGPELAEIRVWRCRFPLPRPFRLGRATLAEREYAIVRVEAANGLHGCAFGLTRDAPVDVVVSELVAPPMLADADGLPDAWRATCAHHAPEGLALRAQSLLDIAHWDLKGKAANEPVWRMLGEARTEAPVMLVEGYEVDGEGDDAFAERLGRAADEGFALLKLANLIDEPERMTRRLRLVRERAPDVGLAVDIGYGWTDEDAALGVARGWDDLALTWIEDPLHGHEVDRIARLRREIRTPIAVGDEVTSQRTLADLVDAGAVDVLRLDATCVGGLTGAAAMVARAGEAGVGASTHIYPEIHRHLVFAFANAGPVEAFRPDTAWETPHLFSAPPATELDTGTNARVMRAPLEPGIGLSIDWERVEAHATRSHVVTAG